MALAREFVLLPGLFDLALVVDSGDSMATFARRESDDKDSDSKAGWKLRSLKGSWNKRRSASAVINGKLGPGVPTGVGDRNERQEIR